jgi:YjbE family integral membrane protein
MEEILTTGFLSALLAIIMIDLVLAGDNAIVIALAARNLPPAVRTKAVVWGTAGAIAVRTVMTLIVVWLLNIPGLMLLGGLALVWIAYKLLADHDTGEKEVSAASSFWGAMKTIIIADAVMGLDNVLAVAGAAHGSFLLVVLGLLISVPIMIGGSQLILKFIERYPAIIYIGGAILAWTAATMISHEPLLKEFIAANPWVSTLLHIAIIGGVLGGGYMANVGEARANVSRHVVHMEGTRDERWAAMKGGTDMHRVLIPVDATGNSLKAVEHVVNRHAGDDGLEVHLVHVSTPLSLYVARFLKHGERESYHRAEAQKALEPAQALLNRFSVPYAAHAELGDKAETIHRIAQRLHADEIVMGTARKNSLTRVLEDSVTNRVIERATIPVDVIAGSEISSIEKIGLPASIGALFALLVVSAQ